MRADLEATNKEAKKDFGVGDERMNNMEDGNKGRLDKKKPDITASFDSTLLGPGSVVGQFRIERELGRGAMGVVYLAHDTKLERSVAIKSLPEEVGGNPLVRSRFQREARLLAGLNHPNIATIHEEIEEAEGSSFLVLEYIAGETLAERIEKGALSIDEALSIGQQIAEGVAAAHEQGVIHRDLKPGNIKITPEGKVKVLDFGLAKGVSGEGLDQESTITVPGRVIGTPAYMSPEQARGNPTDHRSDIWSFGCVLFEMLTGRIPFKGDTVSDTLANILQSSPEWEKLPGNTPANIKVLIRRCMEKDQQRRLQYMADAVIEIRETIHQPKVAPPTVSGGGMSGPMGKRKLVAVGLVSFVVATIATGLVAWNWYRQTIQMSNKEPLETSMPARPTWIKLPVDKTLFLDSRIDNTLRPTLAISRDGRKLVYAVKEGESSRLYIYNYDKDIEKAEPIDGTKGAEHPFFSYDGDQVGFFADGWLKKVSIFGGKPEDLAIAPIPWGGAWTIDNKIIYTPNDFSGLWQVSANGEDAKELTTLRNEYEHSWPHLLPDGKTVIFNVIKSGGYDNCHIAVLPQGSKDHIFLNENIVRGSNPCYIDSMKKLVYAQGNILKAVSFDPKNYIITGKPQEIFHDIFAGPFNHIPQFSISENGTLVYAPGGLQEAAFELVWKYLDETVVPITEPGAFYTPQLSPDGMNIVYTKFGSISDIYTVNKINQKPSGPHNKLTSGLNWKYLPFWIPPHGNEIGFTASMDGLTDIYSIPANSRAIDQWYPLISKEAGHHFRSMGSFSSNGNVLVYQECNPDNNYDIWLFNTDGQGDPIPIFNTRFEEWCPVFSPDDKWIAYISNEEGQYEVYIIEYGANIPVDGTEHRISSDGGTWPFWSSDSSKLYFASLDNNKLFVATIKDVNPAIENPLGKVETLFESISNIELRDVDPNDMRFLGVRKPPPPEIIEIKIVPHLFDIISSSDKN